MRIAFNTKDESGANIKDSAELVAETMSRLRNPEPSKLEFKSNIGQTIRVHRVSDDSRTNPDWRSRERIPRRASRQRWKQDELCRRVKVQPESITEELVGRLQPGMPAEVIVTGEQRNVASYILKPLTDSLTSAFRER